MTVNKYRLMATLCSSVAFLLCAVCGFEASAAESAVQPANSQSSWLTGTADFLSGHLQVGTRITHFALMKDHKDTFLGSISDLEAHQDSVPYKLFADWNFNEYFGVELTWDKLTARTITDTEDHHSDGEFVLQGPIIAALGRYPNPYIYTPYAGIGLGKFSAAFNHTAWWNLGYPSYDDWASQGSPTQFGSLTRTMDLEDTIGYVMIIGCDAQITEHFYADLYARYTSVSVDDHYTLSSGGTVIDDRGVTSIPLDNIAYGLGVKYVF